MSIANWYHNQYSTWNRTRRISQSPYLARQGTNTSAAAQVMAEAAVAGQNMANVVQAGDSAATAKDKKTQEPLFGPSIGAVSSGPAWTSSTEKKVVTDDLTPDIVNSWIEKSKEPSQPTTTLQALVNLKRPSLRLSPLASVPEDGADAQHQHHHGLEFEYDCDAPKCGLYVHVFLPKDHPDAPPTSTNSALAKLLVYESVVEGGFAKALKLDDGALLELGRFEHVNMPPNLAEGKSSDPVADAEAGAPDNGSTQPTTARNNARRRFTHFHFRKRSHNRSVSGPALAVVDAAEPAAPIQDVKKSTKEEAEQNGVRVTIRLAALDEQGTELASPNEQVTYLHIVRFGTKAEGDGDAEDVRPWVVKVVKREATIGPHTFHLHEIFGLTSSTSASYPPTSTLPNATTHTYPPVAGEDGIVPVVEEEDPQSECLLCLSAPREVVLLPCRHLVACKDCALNMVEFGAGGNITQAVEPVTGGEGADGAATEGETAAPAPGPGPATASVVPPSNNRRKRKAKGWFCPVCRQPYTSLLRITTTPPPASAENKDDPGSGSDNDAAQATTEARSGGLLGNALRPNFLRGLSLRSGAPPPLPPLDVESQAGLGRVGA